MRHFHFLSPMQLRRKKFYPLRCSLSTKHSNMPSFAEEISAKHFEFQKLEKEIYKWWEDSNNFKPDNSNNVSHSKCVIPMPPPNVTDIIARFHRMQGHSTLWLPGTDHAGIATQLQVEKLLTSQGSSRIEVGRSKFVEHVWSWKNEKGGYITEQMRRLGASADWSMEKFTLDNDMNQAVTEAFIRLHEKGLIYRGEYMVNWSPQLQTAISDLEVEYTEQNLHMYYFKYKLSPKTLEMIQSHIVGDGGSSVSLEYFIPVATTRPETILGDTAVCVHPDDERYKHLIGYTVLVPMTNREIPIIADTYVNQTFGSGALKITPAHDVNDYQIGKRHNLQMINILNKNGTINENGGEKYMNMDRFVCRKRLWSDMEEQQLTLKKVPHLTRVPVSQRGGDVIEPMISTQWFVKMEDMAKKASDAVRNNEIEIVPARFNKIWFDWLDNIRDWCVSRQLWWGHRIPVYYIDESKVSYVVAHSAEDALVAARLKFGTHVTKVTQDDDVLDTWFSSGLWPFATVGWPFETDSDKYKKYYPATVLETGYDILFFWVARMVMLGIEFTGQVPFHTIFLHGLVLDEKGQKMSKTKGNVVDPLNVMNESGTDALRYALIASLSPGQDIPLSAERIEHGRNFVNKLWNAGKYINMSLNSLSREEIEKFSLPHHFSDSNHSNLLLNEHQFASFGIAERYIISLCHVALIDASNAISRHSYGEAINILHDFLWGDFADWYLEASKTRSREIDEVKYLQSRQTLVYVWDIFLRTLHPFMPYVSEVLWQISPHKGESIMMASWPLCENTSHLPFVDETAIQTFEIIKAIVRSIRNARTEYKVEPGKKISATIRIKRSKLKIDKSRESLLSPSLFSQFSAEKDIVGLLARIDVKNLHIEEIVNILENSEIEGTHDEVALDMPPCPINCLQLIIDEGCDVCLPLADMIDLQKEILRLEKQLEKEIKSCTSLESKLSSEGFVAKAKPEFIVETNNQLNAKKMNAKALEKRITELRKLFEGN